MSTGKALPDRPHPDWYRKAAKKKLAELRESDPKAQLADAQLAVAREYGFPSWRKLIAAIDTRQKETGTKELFAAIRTDDYDTLRRLLQLDPKLAQAHGPGGETPLHLAAEVNNPDTIDILMSHGASPTTTYGRSAHSALSWAVTTYANEAAEALVRNGVRPDLFCAAGMGDVEAVRSFFDVDGRVKPNSSQTGSSRFGPDGERLPCPPNTAREVVSDALYIACRNGRVEAARFLLDRDVDVNFRGFIDGTLLHWAHFGGSREIVEMLLAAGADPNVRDGELDCTPRAFGICVPASWGIVQHVVKRLREDVTLAKIHEGRGTPLHEAARGGHESIVRLLLACGADRTVRDRDGKTPSDLAAEGGHEGVRVLLL